MVWENKTVEYSKAAKSLDTFTLSGKDNLIEYLTHLAFNVTAWHEIVGTLTQYVIPPNGFGFSIRPGKAELDVQSFVQVYLSSEMTPIYLSLLFYLTSLSLFTFERSF